MAEQNEAGSNPTPPAGMEDLFDGPMPEVPDREKQTIGPGDVGDISEVLGDLTASAETEAKPDAAPAAPGGPEQTAETEAEIAVEPDVPPTTDTLDPAPQTGPDAAEAGVEAKPGGAVEPDPQSDPDRVFPTSAEAQERYAKASTRVKAAQTEMAAANREITAAQRDVQTATRKPTLHEINRVMRKQSRREDVMKVEAREAMRKLGLGQPRKPTPPLFQTPERPAEE